MRTQHTAQLFYSRTSTRAAGSSFFFFVFDRALSHTCMPGFRIRDLIETYEEPDMRRAAQVRRAQDAVLKTRPFSETLQKVLGGLIVRLKKDNFDSPLMSERPVNKVTQH